MSKNAALSEMVTLLYAAEIAQWYETIAPQVRRMFGKFGPVSAREADDMTQDVFVKVIEHAAQLVTFTPEHRQAYVFTIAKHVNMDRHRRWALRNGIAHETVLSVFHDLHTVDVAAPEQTRAEWLAHARPDANPEQTTAARMTLKAVWEATPVEERELLLMVMYGYTYGEMQAHFGISKGALAMKLSRLRLVLREAGERMTA